MNYHKTLEKIAEYALEYFDVQDDKTFAYHNKKHTQNVVDHTTEIANHYQVSPHDLFIVCAAAWFHDLGYIVDRDHHETQSALIAENFLRSKDVGETDIKAIKSCIMATKMPQKPVSLLEKIICDADLYHLGTDDFSKKNKLLLKEYNNLNNPPMDKLDWQKKSIVFLEAHQYHTDYCQQLLNDGQQKNIEMLKSKVESAVEKATSPEAKTEEDIVLADASADHPKTKKNKDKIFEDKPDKGIETMFRISSSNHQRLSDMADKKAHIMITVNSIILSALISLVLRRLNEYEYLLVPTIILLSVSVAAMTFSILSTRPSIPNGVFTKDDVDQKKVNLLFFGNFYKMGLEDYTYGMLKMMDDREFLYGSLIKDVYSQGVVLGKKYRLLRIAYSVFMFGLIVSVFAFIIAVSFFSPRHIV
ncbi:Pycsar system effector family protein [Mucilaginibacter sp. X4EP1]|uniref:Pycsar system effector family protein n=1 Tax=Mucilaginibacter sp. X4EP1 TaxID=2723092 RepID=UPI0021697589|nr:Pycsar system effector family protein [Mucilaginibacter sp. X4EP1]MCS3813571.1 putative metal-dependent HD superfamily phosphohydrolase [Mucilaginibacter sp. X4EP1]